MGVTTDNAGNIAEAERYDPWGKTRAGNITSTEKAFTGQRYDTGTGLLFYNARYYDASLARFVSADSIVPGMEDGKGGSAASLGYDDQQALRPLTVDFHEHGFLSAYGEELRFTAQKGFHFQLSDDDLKHEQYQWGPQNAQALNRYAYVLNNPLRYVDPSGHWHIKCDNISCTIIFTPKETEDIGWILIAFSGATGSTATVAQLLVKLLGVPIIIAALIATAISGFAGFALVAAGKMGLHLEIWIWYDPLTCHAP